MVGSNPFLEPYAQPIGANDLAVLDQIDRALADARSLRDWWLERNQKGDYATRFELTRTFNPPGASFGFFDQAHVGQQDYPVMGSVEELLFDTAKQAAPNRIRDQFREFVLRYFMRISDYQSPETYIDENSQDISGCLTPLSWCSEPVSAREGFGYSQLFFKLRNSDRVGKFAEEERFSIVDLREVINDYQWIVLKVKIFDFNLKFAPFGPTQAHLTLPLDEESYLVLSPDFVVAQDDPSALELGKYGFGYAFLKNPRSGVVAYGPGRFDLAFKLITFRVLRNGEIRTDMVFVANRPDKILNFPLNPFAWSRPLADFVSLGMFSRLFGQMETRGSLYSNEGVDPLRSYIAIANILTGGLAAKDFCISREQLEKDMLVQHFAQHYRLIIGSLLTWRQIPDWLDASSLPEWVTTGRIA